MCIMLVICTHMHMHACEGHMCTYARAHITHTFLLQDWKDAFPALPVPVALQIDAGLASHFGKKRCARDVRLDPMANGCTKATAKRLENKCGKKFMSRLRIETKDAGERVAKDRTHLIYMHTDHTQLNAALLLVPWWCA